MGNERRLARLSAVLATALFLSLAMVILGRGGAGAAPRAGAMTLLGLAATCAFAMAGSLPPPFRARPGLQGWMILSLLGLGALGVIHGFYRHAAIGAFTLWGAAAAAYLIALVSGSRRKTNENFRNCLPLLGVMAAAPFLLDRAGEFLPGGGSFVNANHLAALLAVLLPVALAGVLFAGRRRSAWIGRGVAAAFAIVCALALFKTGSRGGVIAAAVGLFCFAVLAFRYQAGRAGRRRARTTWAVAVLLLAAVVCLSAREGGFDRFRPAGEGSESSIALRLSIWRSSVDAAVAGGPLGWGPGSYAWVYPAFREGGIPYRVDHAHNDLLEQTVELGWGFPLLALGLACAAARRALKTCRRTPDRVAVGSAVAGISGLAALGVHAMVDSPLQTPPLLWMAAVLAGLVSASGNIERPGRPVASPPRLGLALGFAAAGCAAATVLLSMGAWREARAEAAVTRAGIALEALAMEQAVTHAREAVSHDPGSAQEHATLGRVLVAAREAGVGGRLVLGQAQQAFTRASTLNPRDAEAWLDLARTAELRNDRALAAAAHEKAVSLDPVSGQKLEAHARFLLRGGDLAGALASLRRSVNADARGLSRVLPLLWDETGDPALLRSVTPRNAPARIRLGDFLETKGRFAQADEAFIEAAAFDPGSATAQLRRARLALREGNPGAALRLAGEAKALDQDSPETLRVLAAALAAEGALESAASTYEALLARTPADKSAALALTGLSLRLGEPERAVEGWLRVTRARPADMDARHALARAHRIAGDWAEAIEVCRAVTAMQPRDTACRSMLVEIYLAHGLAAPARRTLDAWLALAPESVQARAFLARFYELTGRAEEARREYERILELEPGNPEARTALARIRQASEEGAS